MKKLPLTLLCCSLPLLTHCAGARDQNNLPRFSDYPLTDVYTGTLEQVDPDSHADAAMFRGQLSYAEGEAANFAGHYILRYWGCGTGCQMLAIIDAENGEIFMDEEWVTSMGVCYRRDSALLITNPYSAEYAPWPEPPEWFNTGYYYWNGETLEEIALSKEAVTENCGDFL